jgi:hypothetical protein
MIHMKHRPELLLFIFQLHLSIVMKTANMRRNHISYFIFQVIFLLDSFRPKALQTDSSFTWLWGGGLFIQQEKQRKGKGILLFPILSGIANRPGGLLRQ